MEAIGKNLMGVSKVVGELLPDNFTPENFKRRMDELSQQEFMKIGESLGSPIQFSMLKDFRDFIEKRKAFYASNTIRNYEYTYGVLVAFEKHMDTKLDIDIFDRHTFEKFVAFLILVRKLLNNTIDKHVNVLKAFIRDMYPDFDLKYIKYNSYQPDVIALTSEELDTIRYTPFSGYQEKTRDLFLFLCYTGMRYSDSQNFNPSWVQDNLIEYSARKTKARAYVPFFGNVREILEAYGGRPPKISSQKFNTYLKEVIKGCEINRPIILRSQQGRREIETICPIWEAASSHLGRKTFISVMLEKDVPIQDVMNMSGHADYRSMKPYIQVSRKKMRGMSDKLGL